MEKDDETRLPQLSLLSNRDAVILADGDFPQASFALDALYHASYLICCDGAYHNLRTTRIVPNAVVGDGDSLSQEDKVKCASFFYPNLEQETNDLTKAVQFALKRGFQHLLLLGTTGKREDHTLGNISLFCDYCTEGLDVILLTNYGIFTSCNGRQSFQSFIGQQISVFNISCKEIRSQGLLYPAYKFSKWWQGTLNEAIADEFMIEADGLYLVFFVARGKNV